jgi:TRAP-type C4-dicarboxylate transport system permease small subunit
MIKLKLYLDAVLKWVIIVLMGVLVINVLWQVFTRFILNNPSAYTDELARYLLIWVGLLGAAYVAGQKMHLAIDILPKKLTGKSKIILDIFIEACMLVFSLAVMVIGGLNLVFLVLRLNQSSAALQIPLGYVYLSIPLSGAIIVIYAAILIISHVKALRKFDSNVIVDEKIEQKPIN